MLDGRLVMADTEEWLAPLSLVAAHCVIVSPNPSSSCVSWLCDHAMPQAATHEDEIIACYVCYEALRAGAEVAYYAVDL